MRGFLIVRGLFVLAVVYAAILIHPIDAALWVNAALGLGLAVVIAFAEAHLHEAAATHVLGGLLGFGVGLTIAKAIGTSLFWANSSDHKVQFFHSLVILVLPYLGLVTGARMGEWLEPAKLASLFRDARPARRHRGLRRVGGRLRTAGTNARPHANEHGSAQRHGTRDTRDDDARHPDRGGDRRWPGADGARPHGRRRFRAHAPAEL